MVSPTMIQRCHCNTNAARDKMNEQGCVLKKLCVQGQTVGPIRPLGHGWLISAGESEMRMRFVWEEEWGISISREITQRKGLGLTSKINKLMLVDIVYIKTKELRYLCITLKMILCLKLPNNYLLPILNEMASKVWIVNTRVWIIELNYVYLYVTILMVQNPKSLEQKSKYIICFLRISQQVISGTP